MDPKNHGGDSRDSDHFDGRVFSSETSTSTVLLYVWATGKPVSPPEPETVVS